MQTAQDHPEVVNPIVDALPYEVLEHILKYLAYRRRTPFQPIHTNLCRRLPVGYVVPWVDKRDLCSASTVSRRWREAAVPLLYRDILFSFPTHTARVIRGRLVPDPTDYNIQHFIRFLDDRPWIYDFVSTLSLSAQQRPFNITPNIIVSATVLPALLCRMKNLRELSIVGIIVRPSVYTIPLPINTLYLAMPPQANEVHTVEILGFFSTVQNLHLTLTKGEEYTVDNHYHGSLRAFAPQSISVDGDFDPIMSSTFVDKFLSPPARRSLEDLSIAVVAGDAPGGRGLRCLLEKGASQVLRNLQCELRSGDSQGTPGPVSLQCSSRLTVPRLQVNTHPSSGASRGRCCPP